MKLTILTVLAALLGAPVLGVPAPDPDHLEVVLSLDDTKIAGEPESLELPTPEQQPTPIVLVYFFGAIPGNIPSPEAHWANGTVIFPRKPSQIVCIESSSRSKATAFSSLFPRRAMTSTEMYPAVLTLVSKSNY